jgi:hypothetical protein
MQTHLAANLKYGVLVIQSYNRFLDDSGRRPYFTREFFHQDLGQQPAPPRAVLSEAVDLPYRMASDRPTEETGIGGGPVDLAPLVGRWRNTYRRSQGIRGVELIRSGDRYFLRASGIGSDVNWGEVPANPHATDVSGRQAAGFLARFQFGFSDLTLAANEAKGLLIIAAYATFRDGSGRASYFTREFFYRESERQAAQ